MKNDQYTSKPINPITNMLMQLLHWLTLLELSGGHIIECEIEQNLLKLSFQVCLEASPKDLNVIDRQLQLGAKNEQTNRTLKGFNVLTNNY